MAKNRKESCGGGKKKEKKKLQKVKRSCTKKDRAPRKRPRNPFVAFRREVQGRLRARDPTISMPEVTKRAGYCWRKLPEETKDIYRKKVCGQGKGKLSSKCYCPTCKRILPQKHTGSKK